MKKLSLAEKELLLQDLCARQIYGVKALISSFWNKDKESEECITDSIYCVMRDGYVNTDTIDSDIPIENVKPYLRPLSSMTEDEKAELQEIVKSNPIRPYGKLTNKCDNLTRSVAYGAYDITGYLLSKHFDIIGLIEKGLALEAPDGMYKK